MVAEKLTKRLIDTLEYAGDGKRKDVYWDTEIKGFGVRVYPSNLKSFVMSYRVGGKKHLYSIGQYGQLTLEQARELAKKKFGEVADNKDPVALRKETRKHSEWTVKKSFTQFLNRYAKSQTENWQEVERLFKKDVLPAIGKKPIDEVTKEDVLKILDAIVDRNSGTMANRTLAHLKKFFNWCVERDLLAITPTMVMRKPTAEISRDRVLNDTELKLVWDASGELSHPMNSMIKLLILTGQRRGEVATMSRQHYSEEEKLWTLPRELTKSDREHKVLLSAFAIEILDGTPNTGDLFFSIDGETPYSNFGHSKKLLDTLINASRKKDKLPKMQKWRIHDIRRTVASGMARLGVAPHIVEKILNHSSGTISGVAAVYNRYQYTDETKEALNLWAARVREIIRPSDGITETK